MAGTYLPGTSATLTAIPDPGYLFTGWTGDATGTDNPLGLTMDENQTVGADFDRDGRDPDGDGLTNYQEIVVHGTNPNDSDTDGDGFPDGLVQGAAAQSQLGQDIDGEAAGDWSGYRVSLSADGNRVAIGAPWNDGNGDRAGHVRIYELSGNSWVQLGQDIDGEAGVDGSGYRVSLSADGNRVAIGAPGNDGNGSDAGHVRIYELSGNTWIQLGQDIDGEAADDGSGSVSLSADGNRVAIGAPGNDGNGSDAGHVRIYELSGNSWVQLGQDIDGEAGGDFSGISVSLSADGNRVAIGAYGNDGNGGNAGHVRIYGLSGNSWIQLGSDIDGEADLDQSGWSVSLSADGNRVAIGAPWNDGNGTLAGHVRIYELSGNTWIQLGQDIDGEAADDGSGYRVSLSADGNRVAIGAPGNDGNGANAGHVRLYELSGNTWIQLGQDIEGRSRWR